MNHRIPFFISLTSTVAGTILMFLDQPVIGQALFVPGYVLGILAFKTNAWWLTGFVCALPACILAGFYVVPGTVPLLSIGLVLAGFQNQFLEVFLPSQLYYNKWFKLVTGIIGISFFVAGNLVYPMGWTAWVFPGLIFLAANILTLFITVTAFSLVKAAEKGFLIDAGKACPEFRLKDEGGLEVAASDFRGKFLLLVFVRGDWCPGCHIMLRCYERNKAKLLERNVHLLSIGPDPLGVNKAMVEKLGLSYHVLSDERQVVAQQFCVELQGQQGGVPEYDFVPLPASFLIDKEGMVRYTSRAANAGEILYPDKIFEVLDALN
jgi:peroxiredoxin